MASPVQKTRIALALACISIIAIIVWKFAAPPADKAEATATAATEAPAAGIRLQRDAPATPIETTTCEAGPCDHPEHAQTAAIQAPRKMDLPAGFLERITTGDKVALELPDGRKIACEEPRIERDDEGVVMISGTFSEPAKGEFFFRRQDFPGVAGKMVGHVIFDGEKTAWKVLPEGKNGDPVLKEVPIDEVVCVKFMPTPDQPEEMPQDHTSSVPIPSYQAVIPLQSLPGAPGTIYLDFDGSKGPYDTWSYTGDAAPSGLSNSTIRDIWIRVAEDFIPFNINVTTDVKVYENATRGRRIRCIVTPTNWYKAGGVAYVGSYNWGGDPVCWAMNYTSDSAVTVISHEVGHTFGLYHHGQGSSEYYGGNGSGVTAWAPIMGVGYGKNLKHWSRGDYYQATRPNQYDLTTITNQNGVDFRPDDAGSTLATARYLWIAPGFTVTDQEGMIETTGDVDAFRFKTTGGAINLTAITSAPGSNLDILAQVIDASTSAVVATANVSSTLSANIATTLPAGEYLFTVTGTGYGDPANLTGYSNYGSIGSYSISGTVTNGETHQAFTIAEHSANGTVLGTIAPRTVTGSPLSYTIASGNTGGALALNATTGSLTVASSTALNFETLSTRYDVPALLELTINITNTSTSSTENVRALVTVTDVNEAPTLNAVADMTLLEGTAAGTPVVQLSGTDADRFDFPSFEIVSGNSAGVFAINAATGWITVASPPNRLVTPTITLVVRSKDQKTTPLYSATRSITLTIVDVADTFAGTPGSIVRTFFRSITGETVADLTGNAKFPNTPDEEVFLTSFDGGSSQGDNYGSTFRGWVIPPATGNYQFWVSSDNASQLILGSGAAQVTTPVIASVSTYTSQYAWDAQASAASAVIALTAGQPYYIELRHKEATGGDHAAVAWSGPGITRQIIPGLYLAPLYQNYTPKLSGSLKVSETAIAGTVIGKPTVTDVNKQDSHDSYTITAGNAAGLFAINANTGDITLATAGQFSVLATPYYDLTISVTDDGAPPLTGSGVVRIAIEPNQLYFDPNGTTAGGVANGGSYAWRTTSWAAGTGGTLATQAWISSAQANFSATSPAGPLAYDIDIASYNSATHGGFSAIRSLAGTVRFIGNVDNFYLTGPLTVAATNGSAIVFNHTRTSAALQAFNLNGKTATFDGDVTFNTCGMGNGGNVVVNSGKLALNAANLYTGSTTLNGGTLSLLGTGALYTTLNWANQTVAVNPGATLELDRWVGTNRSLGQLDFGPQNLVIDGATLRYTGLTNPVETNNGPAFTIGANGATLESATAGQLWRILLDTRSNYTLVSNGGDLTLTGAGDGEITKVIPGTGTQLIKGGAGTWTLTAANTYDGGTIVQTGTLQCNSPSSLPGAVTIESDSNNEALTGTLFMNTPFTTWSQNVSGSGRWKVATGTGSNTTSLTGDYSGFTGVLEVATGSGKIQLATAAKYPAAGSTVDLTPNTTLYLSGGGTLASRLLMRGGSIGEPTYGQLRVAAANATLTGGVTLFANTTIAVDSSRSATLSGVISESGGIYGFTKNQPGTLTLSGANTYTGGTTVSSGTLQTGATTGTFGSGNLTVATGTTAKIQHPNKALGRHAFVYLNGTGKLDLAAGVSETVARLYVGGVQQPAGTYTAANLSANISGIGSLVVGEILPSAPTNVAASLASWNTVLLTWSHPSVNETDLRVERSLSPSSGFAEIATLAPGALSFVDSGRPANTTYYYRLRVLNAVGFSPYSGVVTLTTRAVDAPAGLAATASTGAVQLTWTNNPDATGYNVKRASVSGGPYTQIGSTATTSYNDTTVTNGIEYFYIVTATAAGFESQPSDEVSARPLPPSGNGIWTADSGGNWSDAENWQNFVIADGAGNSGTFAQPGGGTVTLDTAGRTLGSLAFSNGTYELAGNPLTLDATTDAPVVSVGTGITTTFSTPLGGAEGLQKTGAGRLILTADSAITGSTTVTAGTLTDKGLHASGSFDIASGAVFEIDSTAATMAHVATTFTGAGTLRKSGANRIYWGSTVGTFALSSGALIDVQGGTLTGGSNANEVWTNNKADLYVATGAIFDGVEANVRVDGISGTGTIKTGYSGAGYANLTLGVDNGSSTFDGVLANSSSTGNLVKEGTGTITLAGSNTFTGSVAINLGVLRITRSSGLGSGTKTVNINAPSVDKMLELDGSGGNITLASGISYQTSGANGVIRNLAGNNTIAGAITMTANNGNTRIISNGGSLTLSGNITANTTGRVLDLGGSSTANNTISGVLNDTNAPAVLKTDSGTWIVSGANTYTGATTVSGGTLTLSGARTGSSGAITVSNVAATSATLNIQNGTHALGGNAFSVGSAPTTPAIGTVNQSGGAVAFTGGNAILLGNSNIANTANYNLSGGSITTFTSASRGIMLGTNSNSIANFTLSGTGVLNMTAASGATGDGVLQVGRYDSASTVTTTTAFTQTGGTANVGILSIGGNGSSGSGSSATVALTGGVFSANQFARLSAGNTNTATLTIGGTADVTLPDFPTARGTSSTATLTFDGGTLRPLVGSATFLGGLTNAWLRSGGAKFEVPSGRDTTVTQLLQPHASSSGGTLTKDGAGVLTLNAANTYNGGTIVNDGSLVANTAGKLGTGNLTVNTGATCDLRNAAGAIADAAHVILNGTGKLIIASGVTETVARLYVDSVIQPAGSYTSASHPALISGSGSLLVTTSIPVTPTTLAATAVSHQVINIAWTDNDSGESGYLVERSATAGSGFAQIASLAANTTSYSDTGLSANATWFYRVRAAAGTGNSGYSNEATATTLPTPPAAPASLTATAGGFAVRLEWTAAPAATTYRIKRSTTSGSGFTEVASTTATSFIDLGLAPGVPVFYLVAAETSGSIGADSAEVTATPLAFVQWDGADLVTAGAQGGNGSWNAAALWWNGFADSAWPATGLTNESVFGGSAGTVSLDPAGVAANRLTFNTTGYTLQNGPLTLNGTAPGVFTATGVAAEISSSISGSSGLTKSGPGSLGLSGTNNYGNSVIQQGLIQVNNGGTLGSASGNVTLGTGVSGTLGTVGNLTVNTNTTVGAIGVVSNTSNTTTPANIGQLLVASGRTLTASSLSAGVASAAAGSTNTALATGATTSGGTLAVNGNVIVGASGSAGTTVTSIDLSGLGAFSLNSPAGYLRIGYGALTKGTLTLAANSTINTSYISVGETISSGNSSQFSTLNLGSGVNTIQTNDLRIGFEKTAGIVQFAGPAGSVSITGTSGVGKAAITVGRATGGSYQGVGTNSLLLAGHDATVAASTVILGRKGTGSTSGNVTSLLTFDTGTFTADEIQLGVAAAGNAATSATGTFTLGSNSASNGTLTVNGNFILASNTNSTNAQTANGSFIINGGTANIFGSIKDDSTTTLGTSNTTLTLDGGTLDMKGNPIGGDGTSGNLAIDTLNFRSGTLKNVSQINDGTIGLTKTTSGTLTLSGTHTYTGPTTISAGKLVLDGSLAGELTATSGTLAPQGTPSITGNLAIPSGGRLEATPGVTLTAGGTVTLAGALDLIPPPGLSVGNSFTLVDKTSTGAISGTFTGKAEASIFIVGGQNWQITYLGGDGNDVVVTIVQPLTAADTWRQLHFGTPENTGDAADSADPNNDGETNLVEFATGQDPHAATRTAVSLVRVPGSTLTFTYPRNKAAFDLGYLFVVEYGDTLAAGSWTSFGPGTVTVDGPLQSVAATIPDGPAGRRFIRLKITAP